MSLLSVMARNTLLTVGTWQSCSINKFGNATWQEIEYTPQGAHQNTCTKNLVPVPCYDTD